MSLRFMTFFSALMILCTVALAWDYADAARRFGGGKSFGGKSFMSRPAAKPAPTSPTMSQQAQKQTQQPGAAAAGSRGLFGGMGGLLGGLLAGSLLGSLLFGGGFGGMGFVDILLIGLVLYLIFKFMSRRRTATATAGYRDASPNVSPDSYGATAYQGAPPGTKTGGFDWSALQTPAAGASTSAQTMQKKANLPDDFDEEDFLQGAKATYVRLNKSWDNHDLSDIDQFVSPALMDELRSQLAEQDGKQETQIMLINASLVEVQSQGAEQTASVYFDVLLREDANATAPIEVHEIWHFARPANGNGMWRLDGIQQAE